MRENNASVHYGEKIKDSCVLPRAITVTLTNEVFEHSRVGSAFPTARFHGAAHKTKSSLSICVSVRAKSPKADLCIKCWANSNLGTTVGFI